MKHPFLALLLVTFCATGHAQTIKSLGYNTTNGQIVAATNVVWTNAFSFSTNTVAAQVRTNLGGTTVGNAVFTATNAAVARDAIGLSSTNDVNFNRAQIGGASVTTDGFSGGNFEITEDHALTFSVTGRPATTRTNLGIPLSALTNTSNVTAMRALSGSTNTNEPYSGSVALTNTNVLVFSNGILQSVQ
jgi:hypothetical protein